MGTGTDTGTEDYILPERFDQADGEDPQEVAKDGTQEQEQRSISFPRCLTRQMERTARRLPRMEHRNRNRGVYPT